MTPTNHTLGRASTVLLGGLAVIMIGLALVGGWKTYSPVPHWDMWDGTIGFIVGLHEGGEGNWWAQHNEHRIAVAKLLLHGLAALSRWDVRWEIATNFALGMSTIAATAWIIVRTVGAAAPATIGVLILMTSAMQSSLVQWQSWTWGWQASLFLAEACGPLAAAAPLPRIIGSANASPWDRTSFRPATAAARSSPSISRRRWRSATSPMRFRPSCTARFRMCATG